MNIKNELLLRLYVVLIGFLVASAIIVYKIVQINVIEGEKWREKGNGLYRKYMPIEAERGSILAEDYRPLAVSQPFFEIRMDLTTSSKKDFEKNVDSLAFCINKYLQLDQSPSSFAELLKKKRIENNKYFLIKKKVSYEELEQVKKFPLFRLGKYRGGLIVEEHTTRHQPYKLLAKRSIGLSRDVGHPVGLEGAFDKELAGKTGKRLMQKIDGNTWIPVRDLTEIAPERGYDIVTTIDVDLQDIVHHALINSIKKHKAEFGTAVLMEVETGAIKAISNIGKDSKGHFGEVYNYAVGWSSEPGSTFKTAAVLAMFEDGGADMDTWVNLQKGTANFYGQTMKDSRQHGIEGSTLRKAFEISSNIGIASLVDRHYNNKRNAQQFIHRLKQFGLCDVTNIEIPGEPKPYIKNAFDYAQFWSQTSLAWMSHGYELQITPLQMLCFYNAIANDGRRMRPYLVSEIRSGEEVIRKIKPRVEIDRIARPGSVEKMQILLKSVVEQGTGAHLKSGLVSMAFKTGTAKEDYFKKDTKAKYLSSIAGYFPADNPRYSCIVFIGKPTQNGYYGGQVAGPVFKEIAEKCFVSKLAVANAINKGPRPLLDDNQLPGFDAGFRADFKVLFDELKIEYKEQGDEDWVILMPKKKEVHLEKRKIEKRKVPNVMGMGAKDAVYLLETCGLEVVLKGHGKVIEQSITPGASLQPSRKIYIRLG